MNRDKLNYAMYEGWGKMAFYFLTFFYYLYSMIYVLITYWNNFTHVNQLWIFQITENKNETKNALKLCFEKKKRNNLFCHLLFISLQQQKLKQYVTPPPTNKKHRLYTATHSRKYKK